MAEPCSCAVLSHQYQWRSPALLHPPAPVCPSDSCSWHTWMAAVFKEASWLTHGFVWFSASGSCCSAWESAFEIPGERKPKEQQAVGCLCRMEWSHVAHVCPLFWEAMGAPAPITPVCSNIQKEPYQSTGKTGLLLKLHSVFLTVFLKENSKQEGPDLKPYWWGCHFIAGVLWKDLPAILMQLLLFLLPFSGPSPWRSAP